MLEREETQNLRFEAEFGGLSVGEQRQLIMRLYDGLPGPEKDRVWDNLSPGQIAALITALLPLSNEILDQRRNVMETIGKTEEGLKDE